MAAYAALLILAQTIAFNRIQDKSLFSTDTEGRIRSIHEYVGFLLSFFNDFPDKVNRREGRIRDVAYKTQDIIDFFMWRRIQSHHEAMCLPSIKVEKQLKSVTMEIGSIVGEMIEERPAYLSAAISSSSSRIAPTANHAVIGVQDDQIALKERLCGQSSNLQVIPIVGMGGIGKTTLAKTLYDDPLIVRHFDFRYWITVSQDDGPHKLRTILIGFVESIKYLRGEKVNETDPEIQVYKNLMGRRYLIVIDDVWRKEFWDDIRNIFPDDNNGSRIMLTTRLLDVAIYPDFNSPLHVMRFMNDSQSWDLLKQKAFENSHFPHYLENIGKQIARSCSGLPLAVVLVAGVLSAVDETRWEEIAKTVNPVIGGELEEILSLSYTHLPHHLRPCFLFFGGFPEDANIHASRLISMGC